MVLTKMNKAHYDFCYLNYGFTPGDLVSLRRDDTITGYITQIDDNLEDVTTCRVQWDDADNGEEDIQWTNKIQLVTFGGGLSVLGT